MTVCTVSVVKTTALWRCGEERRRKEVEVEIEIENCVEERKGAIYANGKGRMDGKGRNEKGRRDMCCGTHLESEGAPVVRALAPAAAAPALVTAPVPAGKAPLPLPLPVFPLSFLPGATPL